MTLRALNQMRGSTPFALAAALAVTAIAVALVLSGGPPAVTRSASLTAPGILGSSTLGERICQAGEVLPRDTTAIRVWLETVIGPRVSVQAFAGKRVLTRGNRGPGWTAGSVTIPVTRVTHTTSHVTVCVHAAAPGEPMGLQAVPTPPAIAAIDRQGPLAHSDPHLASSYRVGPLPGRLQIEYLRPGSRSWWSLVLSTARRMGLGHAFSGTWIALLAFALMVGVAASMSWLVLEELG